MKNPNGYVKQTVYIRPDQYLYLQSEALLNKINEKTPRPDFSFVVRDIIDQYRAAQEAANGKGKPKRG